MKKTFYFDVETTGLDPKKNEIVQLAYILDIDGKGVKGGNIWIKPENPENIDKKALDIIGKTKEELMEGIDKKDAYKILVRDLGLHCDKYNKDDKYYPAGYNAMFDIQFLTAFFDKNDDPYLGSWVNWKTLDPLSILRMFDYNGTLELDNYKLETVCAHYGIEIKAHDAMSDIRATRELINKILILMMKLYGNANS